MSAKILTPIKEEYFTPEEYSEKNTAIEEDSNVKDIQFIAPKLGDSHFGYFKVSYKYSVLKYI